MKMRFPIIAAAGAFLVIPGAVMAQQAEPEIDPALLAQLKCELYDDCAAPEVGPAVVSEAVVSEDAPLVVGTRGSGVGIKASPFPTLAQLRAAKGGKAATPVAAVTPSKPRPEGPRYVPTSRTAGTPGLRTSGGAVQASEAVARRSNLFVTFRLGSAELEPTAIKSIDTLVQAMKGAELKGAGKRLRIAGHTDATGDDTVNTQLSAERAAAVRQALIDRGIPAEMLESQGFGSAQPIDGYTPTHGINRRVEAVVID
jgi:outer membrane protein OmpA-like peptidoglycan-associated protein